MERFWFHPKQRRRPIGLRVGQGLVHPELQRARRSSMGARQPIGSKTPDMPRTTATAGASSDDKGAEPIPQNSR